MNAHQNTDIQNVQKVVICSHDRLDENDDTSNFTVELGQQVTGITEFKLTQAIVPLSSYTFNKDDDDRTFTISDVSNVRTFEVFFPFFIRWEYYTELILNSTPSSILDNTLDFDGKNYDVNRIDTLANWELDFRINFECSEGGASYSQSFDYTISTNTYNTHPDITSRKISSFKIDGILQSAYVQKIFDFVLIGHFFHFMPHG